MHAPWKLWTDACQLGLDAQRVIAMRLARISAGGARADAERRRMVAGDRGIVFGLEVDDGAKAACTIAERHAHALAIGPQSGKVVQACGTPCR